MYKPKQEQRNTNRLRLDIEPKLPGLLLIEQQLHEAKGRRGTMIELPFHGNKTLQMWTLSVQWDMTGDAPVWSLYETYSGESKMHWSNPYAQGELPIMYDVICMSIMGDTPQAKIPESLAPAAPPAPPPAPEPAPVAAPPPMPMAYPPPYGMPGMPGMMPGMMPGYPPMDPNMMPPQYPMDPNQQMQQQMPPYGYPYPPMGYPPPGAPWPYQQQPYQGPAQAPGFPPPPSAPAPPPPPTALPPPLPPPAPTSSPVKAKVDYSLVSKRAKIQLGALLIESRLISEPTLDAALRIQEMVEEGLIPVTLAPRALYGFHTKGQAIGEYLPDFETVVLPGAEKKDAPKPRPVSDLKPVYDLIQKAGILTESDMTTALGVRKKHGGELIQILESAKKLDKKTFEAAIACQPLIREGLMKLEQCIIALNYCHRSRVDFDTALEEMDWPNPRKLRKDLPL